MKKDGSWPRRVIRGLRPDGNPLRRKADKAEAYILAGFLAAAIAVAPFAAHLAGDAGHTAAQQTARQELATSHEVKALVLQGATGTASGYSLDSGFLARIRWTIPGGRAETGQVAVPPGTKKGAVVGVWITNSGQLTNPPLQPAQVAGQADLAAAGALAGIGLLYLCEAIIVRMLFNRRRLAAWDADWAATAPMWNRQRW